MDTKEILQQKIERLNTKDIREFFLYLKYRDKLRALGVNVRQESSPFCVKKPTPLQALLEEQIAYVFSVLGNRGKGMNFLVERLKILRQRLVREKLRQGVENFT